MSLTKSDQREPEFGELSKPYPAAVAAFRKSSDKLTPIVDPVLAHGLTDVGMAERLVREHGVNLKFDETRKSWCRWDGNRWKHGADAEVRLLVIELAKNLYLEAATEPNTKAQEAITRASIAYQSHRSIENVIAIARSLESIRDDGTAWNANPDLLATRSGVFDLTTGHLKTGRREDRISFVANVDADPLALCPRWTQFLGEILTTPADIAYVQRAVGYSATGHTREQVVFMVLGEGGNGKSVFQRVITDVLGDYSYAAPFSTFEHSQRTEIGADVAALAGRRFVTSAETNTASRFNEARLKAISGGDRMNARHLYGAPFEFTPVCKLWLSTNHRPTVHDDSFGFWRRLHLIEFRNTFVGSADDKRLRETLSGEAPGILNWIVTGARTWAREGLNPPPRVLECRDEYRRENDPLADFLDDQCEVTPEATARGRMLYEAYSQWTTDAGCQRLSHTAFGKAMGRRFSRQHAVDGARYVGVRLKKSNGC